MGARCLKIKEKVLFNIASEASYIFILSGQKFLIIFPKQPIWRIFERRRLAVRQCNQTGQKLEENA